MGNFNETDIFKLLSNPKLLIIIIILIVLSYNYCYIFFMKYVNKKHEEFYKYEEPILLPKGFVLVNDSEPNGPITLNKELDNGKKRNLFSITKIEDDLLYYNYTEFKNCEKELPIRSEFICEFPNNVRPEVQDGYAISCPRNYKIVIDKAFYGRYENDNNHCTKNKIINKNIKECGTEPIKVVK